MNGPPLIVPTDASGNTIKPEQHDATQRWVASQLRYYLDQLPPGLREDPETYRTLAGVFASFATVDVVLRNRIAALKNILDSRVTRRDVLPLIGTLVGFDARAKFPTFFDEALWRKMLPFAGSIWRKKGVTYRTIIVSLTGTPVWIGGWHQMRTELDETGFPFMGVDAAGSGSNDERTSWVHVPDPIGNYADSYTPAEGEAQVNRPMLEAAIDAVRPGQQRVDLFYYDHVDDFSQGLGKWDALAGSLTLDSSGDFATVAPESRVRVSLGGVELRFKHGVTEFWVRVTGTSGTVTLMSRYTLLAHFGAQFTLNADPHKTQVDLLTKSTGSFQTETDVNLVRGEWLYCVLSVEDEDGTNDRVTLQIDGDQIATGTTPAQNLTMGALAIETSAGAQVDVQLVEQYTTPITPVRVGQE